MKYNDFFKHRNLTDPAPNQDPYDPASGRQADGGYRSSQAPTYASSSYDYEAESGSPYADEPVRTTKERRPESFDHFHSRVSQGKVRLCRCGDIMVKRSRMMLSPVSGIVVLCLGALLMTLYGVMINYATPPWYVKFVLPAVYYIGALFMGVGFLFFFIRERVWQCRKCREIDKR